MFEAIKQQYLNTTMETMLLASVTLSVLLPLVILIVKKGFKWVWEGAKQVAALVFHPGKALGLALRFRWLIHYTIQALILTGLGYLNYRLDLIKYLDTRFSAMRYLWLPLLYLTLYLLAWAVWGLRRVLEAPEEPSEYPDIDLAWAEAVRTLTAENIDLKEVPIFLVLGRSAGDEKALFSGANLKLKVEQTPRSPEAPLHVYASEEAVFVTCVGASLLGQQALLLTESATPTSKNGPTETAEAPATTTPAPEKSTAKPEAEPAAEVQGPPAPGREEQPHATEADKEKDSAKARTRLPLIKSRPEIDRLRARLQHLCWLIHQQRRPLCPINGILLVLPFAATVNGAKANETGLLCQQDLMTIQEVFQVRCPVFALVSDMETTPGFRELIARFPEGQRQRRLGQSFPYVDDLNAAENAGLLESGVDWICRDLFPPLVYRLMRPGKSSKMAALRGNIGLYYLLCEMRTRRKTLSRLLSLAVTLPGQESVLFGGCYLAGTGRNFSSEQAFIPSVFQRLLESQHFVSWTRNAKEEELRYRRWALGGFVGVGAFAVVLAGYVFFIGLRG